MLIAEGKKKIQRNIGVSNVYILSQADFESVGFYAARQYVHLTKEVREKDFFVSDEYEKYYKVPPVSELPLLV